MLRLCIVGALAGILGARPGESLAATVATSIGIGTLVALAWTIGLRQGLRDAAVSTDGKRAI